MGINCILVELYFELINGYDESSDDGNHIVDAYKTVLPQLDSEMSTADAQKFYKGIRCGIIHQGQSRTRNEVVKKAGDSFFSWLRGGCGIFRYKIQRV